MNGFWWRNLDSLGQFVTDDLVTLPTDGMMTTLGLDSAPDMTGMPSVDPNDWYNGFQASGDVIL
jgi:hypothetical protein